MQANEEKSIKKVKKITDDALWEKFCQKCPEDLQCPIRQEPFTDDPVTLKGDKRVYERKEIEGWLQQHNTSPFTRAVLSEADRELVSAPLMKSLVETEFEKFKKKEAKKALKENDNNVKKVEEVKVEVTQAVEMTQDVELFAFNHAITSYLKNSPGIDLFKKEVIGNGLISELMFERRRVFYLLKVVNVEWKNHYKLPNNTIKKANEIIIEFVKKCGFPSEEMGMQMMGFFGSEVSPELVKGYPELCTALISLNILKKGVIQQKYVSDKVPLHYNVDLEKKESDSIKIGSSVSPVQSNNNNNNVVNNNAKISKPGNGPTAPQYRSSFFAPFFEKSKGTDKTSISEVIKESNQQFQPAKPSVQDAINKNNQQFRPSAASLVEYDYLFKIKLYGDSGVGKSCLLLRWAEDKYTESYISTIGVDFKVKNVEINNKIVKMQVWDTAGQGRFRTVRSAYERGVHAAIFVVDMTDRVSLTNLRDSLEEFEKENMASTTHKILVVSKADLENKRVFEMDELEAYAQQHGMVGPIVTSAKTGQGVELAFEVTAKVILERYSKNNSNTSVKTPSPSPSSNNNNNDEQSCLIM